MLIIRNQTKNAQEQALSQGSKQKQAYLMGFCRDPQTGEWVGPPSHGLGVPGVSGDARSRRPCACNFCKVHSTMGCTPSVAAKLETETWTIEKLIEEAAK
jgi:hypothetical protein